MQTYSFRYEIAVFTITGLCYNSFNAARNIFMGLEYEL